MYTQNCKNTKKTWITRFLALCLCVPVLAILTGCGDGLGDDVSETVSRVEDALDGDDTSRDDSSILEDASREEGNLDSDLADDGFVDGDGDDDTVSGGDSSTVTKDR